MKEKNWKASAILFIPFIVLLYAFLLDVFNHDAAGGWHFFETYLPIAFFALLITTAEINNRQVHISKVSFFIGCIAAAWGCLGIAFWKNITEHDRIVHNWNFVETMKFYEDHPIGVVNWGFFLYSEFANAIGFHTTYLSIFFITGIAFGFSLVGKSRIANALIIIGILLLTIEVFLLSSKISLLILLLVFGLTGIRVLYHATKRVRYIAAGAAILFIVTVMLLFPAGFYRFHAVVTDLQSSNYQEEADMASSNLHRLQLWKASLNLFQEKPLTGFGLSGSENALRVATHQNGDQRFNTHNQYLMILISTGILGSVLFLTGCFTFVVSSIRAADYIYAVFLLIILVGLLTENLLSRHAGVVLYSFFNAMFFIHLHNRKNEKI
ncbi:O-antigen ligase family protein [Ohtaekwangia sp.]|uniref:O-antigen ligase family protein n=1 Tax=Ohtaekwangia sp. TaxID=2066019 RepID=UPI002F936E64